MRVVPELAIEQGRELRAAQVQSHRVRDAAFDVKIKSFGVAGVNDLLAFQADRMGRRRLRRDRVAAYPGLDLADLAAGLEADLGEADPAALVLRPGNDHF